MLNKLYQNLLNTDPKNTLGLIDFDDCLDISTVRNLSNEQKQILWDLNHATDGGFIITTNSDGRSIFEMPEMDDFPVISEYATVHRNIKGLNLTVDLPTFLSSPPDSKAAFNAAVKKANDLGVELVDSGEELAQRVSMKIEEKEQGIAAVFGSHAQLADAATKIVEFAFKQASISPKTHEIDYNGKDAREIKVKGARKADAIDLIQRVPNLRDRTLMYAMGDSESDLEVMRRVGSGIVVGEAIKDEKMQTIDCFRITAHNNSFKNSWDFLELLRDTYQSKTKPAPQSRRALGG